MNFLQDLFAARKMFLFFKMAVIDSYGVAFDVLGTGSSDFLMSEVERS